MTHASNLGTLHARANFIGTPEDPFWPLVESESETYRKLPEITAAFWLIKVVATTLGTMAGGYFLKTLSIHYSQNTLFLMAILTIALASQLLSERYRPVLYWFVIFLTATVGTSLFDFMDRTLGLRHMPGSLILTILLVITLAINRFTEGPVSVARIRSREGEAFYWTAIVISNTLGTALGDSLSDRTSMGYLGDALSVGAILIAAALAYRFTRTSRVFLFWSAFILSHPFGAGFGNFLVASHERGGLNLGAARASITLFGILFIAVGYAVIRERNRNRTDLSTLSN